MTASVSLAQGLGVSAACVAGGGALLALILSDDDRDDAAVLFDKYDRNDDGKLSAAEVKAARKDFKTGRLTKAQLTSLTGSANDLQPMLVAGAAVLLLLILVLFGKRIWANITGVFAPKPRSRDLMPAQPRKSPTMDFSQAKQQTPAQDGPKCLEVKIHSASNLRSLMHFTADKPYVSCFTHESPHKETAEAVLASGGKHEPLTAEWEQRLVLGDIEHPWKDSDTLEFRVLSKGLLNSKFMGNARLSGGQLKDGFWGPAELDLVGPKLPADAPGKLKVTVALLPVDLPEDWHAATDTDGHMYFYNTKLDRSQWFRPTSAA